MRTWLLLAIVVSGCVAMSDLLDSDGDGLSNKEELQRGTDYQNADTDGDGLSDYDDPQPTVANAAPPEVEPTPTTSEPSYDEIITNTPERKETISYEAWQPFATLEEAMTVGYPEADFVPALTPEEIAEKNEMLGEMQTFLSEHCLDTIAPEGVEERPYLGEKIRQITWDGLASCANGYREKTTTIVDDGTVESESVMTQTCSKPDGFNPLLGTAGTVTTDYGTEQKTHTFVNKCVTKTQIDVAICDASTTNDLFYSFVRISCATDVKIGYGCIDPHTIIDDGFKQNVVAFEDRKQGAYCGPYVG